MRREFAHKYRIKDVLVKLKNEILNLAVRAWNMKWMGGGDYGRKAGITVGVRATNIGEDEGEKGEMRVVVGRVPPLRMPLDKLCPTFSKREPSRPERPMSPNLREPWVLPPQTSF